MPDEGWYQVHVPKKKMLYAMYAEDAHNFPNSFMPASFDYFRTIWADNFPEIRLRKHCRFAKCDFCVKWRAVIDDQTKSQLQRNAAKDRMAAHIKWAYNKERGFYHAKKHRGRSEPDQCISLAMDGTDQMPAGFPHFWRKAKKDGSNKRLGLRTQIVLVHGSTPQVFLAQEDVAGDPNWTIDTLYRALCHEEKRRCLFFFFFFFFFNLRFSFFFFSCNY